MKRLNTFISSASVAAAIMGSALCASQATAAELLTCTGTETDLTATLLSSDGDSGSAFTIPASTAPLGPPFAGIVHIGVNGTVNFGADLVPYDPDTVPGTASLLPAFAPYHADIDLRDPITGTNEGRVVLCEEADRWFVTWENVLAADATATGADTTNTASFQAVFTVTNTCALSFYFDVEYRYGDMGWEAAARQGGTDGACAPGDTCAFASATRYTLLEGPTTIPGTGVEGAAETLQFDSNVGEPGVWRWTYSILGTETCGDGILDTCAGEECDDSGESPFCDRDCTNVVCGDGILNTWRESCEDGNTDRYDGCSDECQLEECGVRELALDTPRSVQTCEGTTDVDPEIGLCGGVGFVPTLVEESFVFTAPGDGVFTFSTSIDGQAFGTPTLYARPACGSPVVIDCDAGAGQPPVNSLDEIALSAGEQITVFVASLEFECIFELTLVATGEFCGDGNVDTALGEACDDSGESATCNADCTLRTCGDSIVNASAGEECDEAGNTATCNADCSFPRCADEFFNPAAEACESAGSQSETCEADCTLPACGDGVLNTLAGETCDDTGESATCNANCTAALCGDGLVNTSAGEACDDGVAGVPTASATCDVDCSAPACGDGVVNLLAGEACDDGGLQTGACELNCAVPACGDGVLNVAADEACDDGNTDDGDGCSALCALEICGDGVVNTSAEECDDGDTGSDTCDDDCTFAICGDGTVNFEAGEQCDDIIETDMCNADCTIATCGDGVTNAAAGEECDDGNDVEDDRCTSDCLANPFCGDGAVDDGEACDDGNDVDDDGCSAACTIEPFCGDGNVDEGEACDDGNTTDGDGCDSECAIEVEATCGDGNVDEGEACDDGNTTDGDGCDSACAIEVEATCGDGNVDDGEACDDGNTADGDGCDSACAIEVEATCGDGNVDDGETCDDGNTTDGDGCDSACAIETTETPDEEFAYAGGACNSTVAGDARRGSGWLVLLGAALFVVRRRNA